VPTVAEALAEGERSLFVGRAGELALFERWLDDNPHLPELLEVTGPGGIGKTSLLAAFRRLSEQRGRPVVQVDLGGASSNPAGLLGLLGGEDPASVAAQLNRTRPLVLLDTFEDAAPSQVVAPPVQPAQPAQTSDATAPGANSPAVQPNAPASASASVSVDPAAAPAGATVTISGQGLGGGRSAWINLSHMTTTTGLNLGAKQLATVNTAPDGTLNASVTVPSVPSWTAGTADICIINATAQPVCTPFTLASTDVPVDNTAATPDAIVGHYQCSSALVVGFGGGWCSGSEPILALNGDGTYSWGDEQGGWTFDGTTVSFDGGLGNGHGVEP
jgi:hypothetical protein